MNIFPVLAIICSGIALGLNLAILLFNVLGGFK